MIGCLQTRVRKQPIIALYFEFENELKFYNLEAGCNIRVPQRYAGYVDILYLYFRGGAQTVYASDVR